MKFSVLMSVYYKETPKFLNTALESIWEKQSLKPNQIVLVQDGELGVELQKIIDFWKNKILEKLKVIVLTKNIGLGGALNIGLKNCDHKLIARMDSDDISVFDRFEKQIKFFKNNPDIDVLGGYIKEFGTNEGLIKYPLKNDLMLEYFGKRNPIAHVTVMFKKSFFTKAGFYPTKTILNEDTILWLNGFKNKCKFENLAETLVMVRVNHGTYNRRNNFKKVFGDSKDRIKVINTLRLNKLNYFFVFTYFILMISPRTIKNKLISKLRYAK